MVAMFGRIMPEPLAMPVTVMVVPLIVTCREIALATMSVVMIACAASNQLSARMFATQPGRPAAILPTGSGSMMTPVENGRICVALQPSRPASAAQVVRASCMPCSPVPALALPVLTSSARMPSGCARCSRATITGAAQKRFWVNTPATRAPSLNCITSKSLRFSRLMFASVTPKETPATGNSCAAAGGVRLTGMKLFLVATVRAVDVVAELRRFGIHAPHDAVHVARQAPHDAVHDHRMAVDQRLESGPLQAQHLGIADGTQRRTDLRSRTADKGDHARQVARFEDVDGGFSFGALDFYFNITMRQDVQVVRLRLTGLNDGFPGLVIVNFEQARENIHLGIAQFLGNC